VRRVIFHHAIDDIGWGAGGELVYHSIGALYSNLMRLLPNGDADNPDNGQDGQEQDSGQNSECSPSSEYQPRYRDQSENTDQDPPGFHISPYLARSAWLPAPGLTERGATLSSLRLDPGFALFTLTWCGLPKPSGTRR